MLKKIVEVKEQNIATLKALYYGMYLSPSNMSERVNNSQHLSSVQTVKVEQIVDLELRLKKDKRKLLNLYTKIDKILSKMNNKLFEIVIREFDLNDLTLNQIAKKYSYSIGYIKDMHSKASRTFYACFKGTKK